MNSKISVVIPAYNCSKYIAKAIDSVLCQSYQDFEIVVVDDGSTDDTAEILKHYSSDERIKYVYQENQGPGAARNRGMRLSEGYYICFLDADDVLKEDSLKVRYETLASCQGLMMVFTDYSLKNNDEKVIESYLCYNGFIDFFGKSIIRQTEKLMSFDDNFVDLFYAFTPYPIWTGTVMIKRAVIVSVGFFKTDLRVSEDTDYWIRIAENNLIGYINEPTSIYNHCYSNLTKNNTERYYKDRISSLKNVNLTTKIRKKIIYTNISDAFFNLGYHYYNIDKKLLALKQYIIGLKYNIANHKCLKGLVVSIIPTSLSKKIKTSVLRRG